MTTHNNNQTPPALSTPQNRESGELVLELKDIHLSFGDTTVLNGVNLNAHRNEITTLLGPSGSGKSTLIRIVSGLLNATSGELNFPENTNKNNEKPTTKIGMAFQQGALFTSLTVFENMNLVLKNSGEKENRLNKTERKERIEGILELVGLSDSIYAYPSDMSGGMQKRVGIARALAIQPDIMLYDEPFAGLDPILSYKLEQELTELNQNLNMATLIVTHRITAVENMADKVALLNQGKFIFQGDKKTFMSSDDPAPKQFRERLLEGPIKI